MRKVWLSLLCLSSQIIFGQDFTENVIDDNISSFTRSLKSIDLNNDGLLDFVAQVNGNDNNLSEILGFLNNGDTTFEKITIAQSEANGFGLRDVEFLDINNDGIDDIIAAINLPLDDNSSLFRLDFVYILNNNDGSFEPYTKITNGIRPRDRSFEILDVDNDGREDILFIRDNVNVDYLKNNGNGNFSEPINIFEEYSGGVYTADFNGDNLKDIVGELNANELGINELGINEGGDAIFTIKEYPSTPPEILFTDVEAISGDIDGDGTEDLLLNGVGINSGLVWYSNDGSANLTFEQSLDVINSVATLGAQIVDFNNDGNADIITGIFQRGNGIPYFINQGNNDYSVKMIIDTPHDLLGAILPFDVNNDGKMDFISAASDGIFWYENNITLSLEDENLKELKIIPSISSGIFKIENLEFNNIQSVKVFDNAGRQVFINMREDLSFDLSQMSIGIYFVEIVTENERTVKRVIKK